MEKLHRIIVPNAIRNETQAFRNVKQHLHEDEHAFAARVNISDFRYGDVHYEYEKMKVLVHGLDNRIRTVLARFRPNEAMYDMTFERLVQFSKDEGDSYRVLLALCARVPSNADKTRTRNTPAIPLITAIVFFADPVVSEEGIRLNDEESSVLFTSTNTSDL